MHDHCFGLLNLLFISLPLPSLFKLPVISFFKRRKNTLMLDACASYLSPPLDLFFKYSHHVKRFQTLVRCWCYLLTV